MNLDDEFFARAIYWNSACSGEERAVYVLDKKYSLLTGSIGLSNNSPAGSQSSFEIWSDTKQLAAYQLSFGEVTPVGVDVSEALQLIFVVLGNEKNEIQVFGDPLLFPKE